MAEAVTDTVAPGEAGEAGTAPPSPLAPGAVLAGRWEVVRLLGSGGSGYVYEARDQRLGVGVALKLLRPDRVGPSALTRFRREVRLAREVESPRLVRVFELEEDGSHVFLTMELVEGEPLRGRIGREIAVGEALRLGRQVLEALAALHARGIVHRDVKPGNVLVLPSGDVKVVDFGLARRLEGNETRATETEGLVGTLEYLSPEQALGKDVDARSDLFSFGVLLFELLAGVPPWPSAAGFGSLVARLKTPARDLRELRPDVPRWLAALVARLLEKEPARRYPSAGAVLDELSRGRLSIPLALRRWRRPIAAGAALVLSLAIVAAGLAGWMRRPRFHHLAADSSGGARAVDATGRTLWKEPLLEPVRRGALVRRSPGEKPVLAAILLRPREGEDDPAKNRILSWIDPDTGALLGTDALPKQANLFPDAADRYVPTKLDVVDFDGDGADDVVVSYSHTSDFPSYVQVLSPLGGGSSVLFRGSGHHRFHYAADVDGDGRKEAILIGLNNVLGWYGVVAVTRVPRIEKGAREGTGDRDVLASPDSPVHPDWNDLLEYVLLPRGIFSNIDGRYSLDVPARVLTVPLEPRGPVRVSLAGCGVLESGPAPSSCEAGRAARRRAWDHVRAALSYLGQGEAPRAVASAGEAISAAEAVPDPILAEASRRILGRALVASGRFGEAEKLFGELYASSENAPEIADDAGKAFHLAGRLEAALGWYQRGTTTQGLQTVGRARIYMVDEAVMVLCEEGRLDEAAALVDRFAGGSNASQGARREIWSSLLRWRRGGRLEAISNNSYTDDTSRYWLLEFAVASGGDPARLLAASDDFLTRYSGPRSLALSVRAEILDRLGRRAEAWTMAQESWELGRAERLARVEARAHFDVVTERYVRLAEATGRTAEAARARAFLKGAWGGPAPHPVARPDPSGPPGSR